MLQGGGGLLNPRLLQLINLARRAAASGTSDFQRRWLQQNPFAGAVLDDPTIPLPRFIRDIQRQQPQQLPPGTSRKAEPVDLRVALQRVKDKTRARFDETVDVAVNLGTDPRRGDQMVRGVTTLPHGTGRAVRVGVFAQGEAAEAARRAGAEVVGGEELVAAIAAGGAGAISFDKCLATADMASKLGRVARVLGPRGLMPNAKLGTIVTDVVPAIRSMKEGRVEFRSDKGAVVHAGVGKASFPVEELHTNVAALVGALLSARPKGLKGGGANGYLLRASVSSTMGPSVPVSIQSLAQAAAIARSGKR